jgi:hypothetical protein
MPFRAKPATTTSLLHRGMFVCASLFKM